MSTKQRHLLFVYGTLKSGQPNHFHLKKKEMGEARYIGPAETVEKWPLVVATRFNVPYLVKKPGVGRHIKGEVYEVDKKMLEFCDYFEDAPDVYQRFTIEVRHFNNDSEDSGSDPDDGDNVIKCSCYVLPRFADHILQLPFIEDYDDERRDSHYDFEDYEDEALELTLQDLGIS